MSEPSDFTYFTRVKQQSYNSWAVIASDAYGGRIFSLDGSDMNGRCADYAHSRMSGNDSLKPISFEESLELFDEPEAKERFINCLGVSFKCNHVEISEDDKNSLIKTLSDSRAFCPDSAISLTRNPIISQMCRSGIVKSVNYYNEPYFYFPRD